MPAKLKKEEVILSLYKKYPLYDFSKFEYKGTYTESIVICPEHGEVTRKYKDLVRTNSACKFCACRYDTSTFIQKIIKSHPNDSLDNYDFSNVTYKGIQEKYEIFCNRHEGVFSQVGASLVQESSLLICPVCNVNNRVDSQFYTLEKFLETVPESFKELDDFSESKYLGSKLPIDVRCKKHNHVYSIRPNDYQQGSRCNKCSNSRKSKPELEIFELISSWGVQAVWRGKRDIIKGKEIDIYIPNMNLGIEYNGLFHHRKLDVRDYYKNKMASNLPIYEKSNLASDQCIFLIHIFEDEWLYRKNAVENRLKSILGVSERVYARSCKVREVPHIECKEFEERWHLQGHVKCSTAIGLYLNDKLVACMTFGKPRFDNDDVPDRYEMLRFCSSLSVVGGFSKLLTNFIRTNAPKSIMSYSDKRWGVGNVYEKNGFDLVGTSEPGFFWVKGRVRYNRLNFQRWKLDEMFDEVFPEESTADDILYSKKYIKVEDCGQDKWVLDLK